MAPNNHIHHRACPDSFDRDVDMRVSERSKRSSNTPDISSIFGLAEYEGQWQEAHALVLDMELTDAR